MCRGYDACALVVRLSVAVALTGATVAVGADVARAATASVAPDGTLVVNGAPFFPIGIVHTSWIGNRTGGKTIPDLEVIADAGFNLIHPTLDIRASVGDLLDAAATRGLLVIGEVPWPANGPDDFIQKWRDRPAIMGWNVSDDFNAPYTGPLRRPPSEVADRTDRVHSLAPSHVAFGSGGAFPGFRIAEYAETMDVMGFQSYPVSAGNNEEPEWLQENADSFAWVRDQLAGTGQVFLATPQAFRWKGRTFTGAPRWPTEREERNMVFDALVRGAKGVLWYTAWGENGFLPTANPALWSELAREVVELKSLAPFFLAGTRSEIATGDARVPAAVWRLDGRVLAIVVCTDTAAAHPVSIAVGGDARAPAHVVFPARAEHGLAYDGAMLVGSIGPEDVEVVLLDTAPPGDASPSAAFDVAPDEPAFGEAVSFSPAGSTDPDGSIAAWDWDLGDGSLATGAAPVHAYAKPGTYHVRLTVRDDAGATATEIAPIDIGVTSLCPPSPIAGCRAAATPASIDWKRPSSAARRSLKVRWSGAIDPSELADPTAGGEVAVCLYDAGGRVLATGARGGGARWTRTPTGGFRMKDASGSPGGLTAIRLEPGVGAHGLVDVKGKGALLPGRDAALALPVRLQTTTRDGGACWEASFSGAGVTSNDAARFRAR
ncbi:MAG TPA: PKD domain-containing protein [Candidatus Binatia bacterium]|nr:PKD domain-containing protein [Candidatus Binatia bacterium]